MAQEVETASFKIQAKTVKETKNGLKIAFKDRDNWYGAFKTNCTDEAWNEMMGFDKGDMIQFPYVTSPDGVWRNIVGKPTKTGHVASPVQESLKRQGVDTTITPPKQQDAGHGDKDIIIARHVALKAAVDLRKGETAVVESEILKTAKIFFNWLMGKQDVFEVGREPGDDDE